MLLLLSCNSSNHKAVDGKVIADKFNNEATGILKNNFGNRDSMAKCIALLDSAIKYDNGNPIYYMNKLSCLCADSGSGREALDVVNKLISLTGNPKYQLIKANLLENTGCMDDATVLYQEVLKEYDMRIIDSPANVHLKVDRLFALLFLKDKDEVLKEVEKLKNDFPEDDYIHGVYLAITDFNRADFIKSICH